MRSKDAFDELERLVERAGHPFPIAKARSLVLRATGRTQATDELAKMINRFDLTLQSLAIVLEEVGDISPNYTRLDVLDDIVILRRICSGGG